MSNDPAESKDAKKAKKKSSSSSSTSAATAATDGAAGVAEAIEAALRAHKKSALGSDISLKHTVRHSSVAARSPRRFFAQTRRRSR